MFLLVIIASAKLKNGNPTGQNGSYVSTGPIGEQSEPDGDDWLTCTVEDNVFHGYGGPEKSEEIFKCFLDWNDDKNSEQTKT